MAPVTADRSATVTEHPLGGGPFVPGAGAVVPPPPVPLAFMASGGAGLVCFGAAVTWVASRLGVAPTHPDAVAAVHLGMLGFLTTTVLGALHQFAPVVGRRRLRCAGVAWATLALLVAASLLIPIGFARDQARLVSVGGASGAIAVLLAAWNLSGPLSSQAGGLPLMGLRASVAYLVATVAFGLVYAVDREVGWFGLIPSRVLAHAHLGLLGWLGLTYVSVAEKLWPMFLLAHRMRNRSGPLAVALLSVAVPVLTVGLVVGSAAVVWAGGVLVASGLAAHLTSLVVTVRRRRRRLELLHAFLFVSSALLVVAVGLALGAAVSPAERGRLVGAEVGALVGWLALAVLGHAHKIVPFIAYTLLRSRGVRTNREGRALLFGDLFDHRVARATLVLSGAGFGMGVAGMATTTAPVLAAGGATVAGAGALAWANLAFGPWWVARSAGRAVVARGAHRAVNVRVARGGDE